MSIHGITVAGKGFEGMREAELRVLEDTRTQVGTVAKLRARCNEIVVRGEYRSPAFDGMAGGAEEPCGLDGSEEECNALLTELEREEAALARMISKCEKIIDRSRMNAEMRKFCRNYYLRRMGVDAAADYAGICRRTGWNYRAEILGKKRRKNQTRKEKTGL